MCYQVHRQVSRSRALSVSVALSSIIGVFSIGKTVSQRQSSGSIGKDRPGWCMADDPRKPQRDEQASLVTRKACFAWIAKMSASRAVVYSTARDGQLKKLKVSLLGSLFSAR